MLTIRLEPLELKVYATLPRVLPLNPHRTISFLKSTSRHLPASRLWVGPLLSMAEEICRRIAEPPEEPLALKDETPMLMIEDEDSMSVSQATQARTVNRQGTSYSSMSIDAPCTKRVSSCSVATKATSEEAIETKAATQMSKSPSGPNLYELSLPLTYQSCVKLIQTNLHAFTFTLWECGETVISSIMPSPGLLSTKMGEIAKSENSQSIFLSMCVLCNMPGLLAAEVGLRWLKLVGNTIAHLPTVPALLDYGSKKVASSFAIYQAVLERLFTLLGGKCYSAFARKELEAKDREIAFLQSERRKLVLQMLEMSDRAFQSNEAGGSRHIDATVQELQALVEEVTRLRSTSATR
ncbi:unnamed protein product [Vitrella brassicaformis CCMP3155]|uniref:Uncharacterized protein n=2 Tax=Vitrella brassicaformis TaxID=1169539 RepID=A0A0G4EPW3_VITBC|nr:unnamed protein product [Vitrella brassicaformis CCMP3155]|eukprot:CEL99884.1 unnamed protein product [Vitrella brassicaformis CCMP3155]